MATSSLDFGDTYTRRLLIYILIDCSESMVGEPLDSVNQGLIQLVEDLRNDPVAVETAWLSLITFAGRARQVVPLTEITGFRPPSLTIGPGTSLGAALRLVAQCINRDIRKSTPSQKGDWKPLVFLLTDGKPTDNWQDGLTNFRTDAKEANIIGIGCGEDADTDILKAITPNVLLMKSVTPGSFKAFFNWVSSSVRTVSVSASRDGKGGKMPLPPSGVLEMVGNVSLGEKYVSHPGQIILSAHCRDTKLGYLMRYKRISPEGDTYQAEKAYKVGNDYFGELFLNSIAITVDAGKLTGAPACPYCGRKGWRRISDIEGLECSDELQLSGKKAQVLFVLDVTGSMSGEIRGVKESIKQFLDFIHTEGLSIQVGLIAFRDLTVNELPEVLKFGRAVFTEDVEEFKAKVSGLKARGGGGNAGVSSYDALVLATKQKFEDNVSHILILITDQPPLLPDGKIQNIETVVSSLKKAQIDQLYIVTPERVKSCFSLILTEIQGQFFELGTDGRGVAAFQKILLNIGQSISVAARLG
jgi:uncharacterized protein YegL